MDVPAGNPCRGQGESEIDGTTPYHKTHSTEAGDEVAVAYAWHPWAGRSVRVDGVIERATGASVRCSLVGAAVARAQEIPIWMLDAAACRMTRAAREPVVTLPALEALRSLLLKATTRAGALSPEAAIASPDQHRGDRNAPLPPSAPNAGPPTQPHSRESAADARLGAWLERPAGADAARGDRADDTAADRPRPPRGPRAGERRR